MNSAALLKGKHIVCVGAGTGQRNLLAALAVHKDALGSISAVVSVTDNGGHSGQLRKELGIPQVGDAFKCLLALAQDTERLAALDPLGNQTYRREDGTSPGNNLLANYTVESGLGRALELAGRELDCCGSVYPSTEESVDICAQLSDGSRVCGEWEIIERDASCSPIVLMSLSRNVRAYAPAIEAIRNADIILVSPGSLHTGIISALLAKGIQEAIVRNEKARLVQVINLMTQPNLTNGWDAERHVHELKRYTRQPDAVVVNTAPIPEHILAHYAEINSTPVVFNGARQHFPGVHFVEADLVPGQFPGTNERPGNFKKWTHLLTHERARLFDAIARASFESSNAAS